jgi:exo-beta-1,3-glucanase (GH17 family)
VLLASGLALCLLSGIFAWRGAPAPARASQRAVSCAQPQPQPGKLVFDGLGYGPYHAGQDPNLGSGPLGEEVHADVPTLSALTRNIRIYASGGPAPSILREAERAHLCVSLGIWLGRDPGANAAEIARGERLTASPAVYSVIVGNEVLLRGDLSAAQLMANLRQVRSKVGQAVAISYADDFSQWLEHPELADVVDFITVHVYPFWNHQPIASAIPFLDATYRTLRANPRFRGKQIVIGETGWPSDGTAQGAAMPGPQHEAQYVQAFTAWAQRSQVHYFYFETFDESWKTEEGGGVGPHWGLL